jgi:predicted dehydrogenase
VTWGGGDWDAAEITYQPHGREPEPVPLLPARAKGQASLVSAFVEAVREGREPETSAADNLRSLAMVLGAVESADSGVVVELDQAG